MIRAALLLATSCVQGGCGPPAGTANLVASGNGYSAAPMDDSGQQRDSRPGIEAVSQTRISIASDRGSVTAELADNEAARALARLLPLTIEMRDHLGQEKTGSLPSPLPEAPRQAEFSAGNLGLWGNRDFVVYYRDGSVPKPGIVILGRASGDLSIFEGPEAISVRLERAE